MVTCPIFDTHIHYWDVARFHYPWHRFESGRLNRSCLPETYSAETAGYDVQKVLLIEAGCLENKVEAELDWFEALAETDRRVCGVITRFDLDRGAGFSEQLERARRRPLVRGGRTVLQAYQDERFCLSEDFLQAALKLEGTGMVLEIGMNHRHTSSVANFLEKLDGRVQCVIDHMGYPDLEKGDCETWADELRRVAEFDNVTVKISSLTTTLPENSKERECIVPFAVSALKSFGPERVMFGSDWPTITKNSDFVECAELTARCARAAGFDEEQTANLFMKNAERIFAL